MTYISRFIMVAALTALVPTVAFAEDCTADAIFADSKQVQGQKYLFSFEMNSDDCVKVACSGNVKYTVTYNKIKGTNETTQATGTVAYKIPAGTDEANINSTTLVGAEDNSQIVDVSADEVTCTVP